MRDCLVERLMARPDSRDFAALESFARPRLLRLFVDGWTALVVPNSLVQKLLDQTTEPVSDRANGLCVAQAWDETAIEDREDSALGLRRGVGCLIEDAPHLAVPLRTAVTVVHARALFTARAGAHPGGEVFGGRKRRGGGTDSAMICWAESTPRPGTSANRCTASWW